MNTQGEAWVTTVTCALTGAVSDPTPYLDGGWSGGGQQVVQQIQRSATPTVAGPWTGVRVPPYSINYNLFPDQYAYTPTVDNDWQIIINDYEYPGGLYDQPQTVYYAVANLNLDPYGNWQGGSPSQLITVTSETSLSPDGWWLSDVLVNSNTVELQVKEFSADQEENQTIFMPMGRGRKVVIGDTLIFGETIHLKLQTVLPPEKLALMNLYQVVYPLVLRSPDGDMWPVRLTKRSRQRTWTGSYARMLSSYSIDAETVDVIP
jgi:hypothetical protein